MTASTPSNQQISLRDACDQDDEFLFAVYSSTRADELALVPWSDEQREAFLKMQFTAQHKYYRDQFGNAAYQVILLGGEMSGRLYVLREDKVIRILDITLLPQCRNRGIGTFLLREIQAEADRQGKAVQIYVETFNRSLGLFERLGFTRKAEEGINYLMEWTPQAIEQIQ